MSKKPVDHEKVICLYKEHQNIDVVVERYNSTASSNEKKATYKNAWYILNKRGALEKKEYKQKKFENIEFESHSSLENKKGPEKALVKASQGSVYLNIDEINDQYLQNKKIKLKAKEILERLLDFKCQVMGLINNKYPEDKVLLNAPDNREVISIINALNKDDKTLYDVANSQDVNKILNTLLHDNQDYMRLVEQLTKDEPELYEKIIEMNEEAI